MTTTNKEQKETFENGFKKLITLHQKSQVTIGNLVYIQQLHNEEIKLWEKEVRKYKLSFNIACDDIENYKKQIAELQAEILIKDKVINRLNKKGSDDKC